MVYIMAEAVKAMKRPEWAKAGFRFLKPWWSFDNDRIHTNKERLRFLRINGRNRVPLPPRSHDMHRVIEHCINALKAAFQQWLYTHPAPRSVAEYRAALEKIFFTQITAESIAKDVRGLPALFRVIASKQFNGGWTTKSQL